MSNVSNFIKYLERLELVKENLSDKVHKPKVSKEDRVRSRKIDPERIQSIMHHLEKFHYASRDHVIFLLLWRTGMRTGALHSLDLGDFDKLDKKPVLDLHHRPDEGTRLKNKSDGERPVNLSEKVAEVLQDYISHNREKVEDEYGRAPLITSRDGRYNKSSIRDAVYYFTCPQVTGIGECDCGEGVTRNDARACEESVSPHLIRAASITHWRNEDVNVEIVSDRMDVSPEIIRMHYDKRTKKDKARLRRKYVDQVE